MNNKKRNTTCMSSTRKQIDIIKRGKGKQEQEQEQEQENSQ